MICEFLASATMQRSIYSIVCWVHVVANQARKNRMSNHAEDAHILSPVIPFASGRRSRFSEFSNVLSAVISGQCEHRK